MTTLAVNVYPGLVPKGRLNLAQHVVLGIVGAKISPVGTAENYTPTPTGLHHNQPNPSKVSGISTAFVHYWTFCPSPGLAGSALESDIFGGNTGRSRSTDHCTPSKKSFCVRVILYLPWLKYSK